MGSSDCYNFVDEILTDRCFDSFGILAANESKFRRLRASLEKWEDILKGDHEYERRKKSATSLGCLRRYMGDSSWVMVTEARQDETRFHIAMGEQYAFDGNFDNTWRETSGGWRMKRPIDHEGVCRLFTSKVMRDGDTFSTCFGGRIENFTSLDFCSSPPDLAYVPSLPPVLFRCYTCHRSFTSYLYLDIFLDKYYCNLCGAKARERHEREAQK